MVGLLYQGQYHLSPGFNYRLCGWHTNLLVCAELNPWVQSCITKATIFSAPKIRRHMHGLTTDCFFLICELFIWRLSKIQNSITFSCTFNEFTLPKRYLADVYQCHDQHEHTFILVASSWLNFSIINRKFDHFLYPEWGNLGQCLTPLTPCCTHLIGFQLITFLGGKCFFLATLFSLILIQAGGFSTYVCTRHNWGSLLKWQIHRLHLHQDWFDKFGVGPRDFQFLTSFQLFLVQVVQVPHFV